MRHRGPLAAGRSSPRLWALMIARPAGRDRDRLCKTTPPRPRSAGVQPPRSSNWGSMTSLTRGQRERWNQQYHGIRPDDNTNRKSKRIYFKVPQSSAIYSALTSRATHAHPTSPRSTGFCAIWDCISPSSSGGGGGGGGKGKRWGRHACIG